ncbi:cytochrome C oxidase copper chaperone-domain-containing protein [Xylaria sp. FL0043]|nr:cytochrome C oxidase copper chaperone-domain-containing protein [Xylaria sp. FL0043]
MSSSISMPSIAPNAGSAAPAGVANTTPSKPKPCCVCKDEKALRDECMLLSTSADPASNCKSIIDQYKTCMAGYGFKI